MLDVNNRRAEPSIAYVSVWLREFRLDLNGVFFSFFFFFLQWSFMNIRGRHALVDDGLPEYP
jgi:hypothetical protein